MSSENFQYPIKSFSVTESLKRDYLSQRLSADGLKRVSRGCHAIEHGDRQWIFFFSFGAVVFVNVDEADRNFYLSKLEIDPLKTPEDELAREDYTICIGDPIEEPDVSFEDIYIPEWNFESIYLISLCMAKSNALELMEYEVTHYLSESELYMNRYESSWLSLIFARKKLITFLSYGIRLRHKLFNHLGLLEDPDITWDREDLNSLNAQLYRDLDIEERLYTVEKKLELSAQSSELLVSLSHAQHSELLEIIIIFLIAFEIIQAFPWH